MEEGADVANDCAALAPISGNHQNRATLARRKVAAVLTEAREEYSRQRQDKRLPRTTPADGPGLQGRGLGWLRSARALLVKRQHLRRHGQRKQCSQKGHPG